MNVIALSKALTFTLKLEGGYVNNPADHGGPTDHGITQATYDKWHAGQDLPPKDIRDITDSEVQAIYAEMYWLPAHCDDMSLALAICMFDWAVNHGPEGAMRTLQQALMIPDDGIYGAKTRAALASLGGDDLWREFNKCRRDVYVAIVNRDPTQQQFLKGWLGRVDRLDAYIETL